MKIIVCMAATLALLLSANINAKTKTVIVHTKAQKAACIHHKEGDEPDKKAYKACLIAEGAKTKEKEVAPKTKPAKMPEAEAPEAEAGDADSGE